MLSNDFKRSPIQIAIGIVSLVFFVLGITLVLALPVFTASAGGVVSQDFYVFDDYYDMFSSALVIFGGLLLFLSLELGANSLMFACCMKAKNVSYEDFAPTARFALGNNAKGTEKKSGLSASKVKAILIGQAATAGVSFLVGLICLFLASSSFASANDLDAYYLRLGSGGISFIVLMVMGGILGAVSSGWTAASSIDHVAKAKHPSPSSGAN